MADQHNIQDELRDLNSDLPRNNSQHPFSVPEGYFDGLAASILAKVKGQVPSAANELQELSPLLAGLSRQMPYTVPEGYFADNLAALPSFNQETESEVLSAIGKAMPYTVPQGYFEALPQQVLAKLSRPSAKVVPLFARRWMRVAAAAVVGGVMLVGGYRLLNQRENEEPTAATYRQPDTTGKLVAKAEKPSVTQDISKASTEDLDAFIKSVPLNQRKLQGKASQPATQGEVKDLLKDVSEKEIDNFLDQLPTADEDLAIID